jgi:hypothetical protein
MKTAVTTTSIAAFHDNAALIASQRESVALFILSETKAGHWTWIRKVSENADKIGFPGLAQLSSASRAMNELKGCDVIINGTAYVMHRGASFVPKGGRCKIEPWALVLKGWRL